MRDRHSWEMRCARWLMVTMERRTLQIRKPETSDEYALVQTISAWITTRWRIDRVFLLMPAQQCVGRFLATFEEFPPSQKVGTVPRSRQLSPW
jgi:hypothetical protein